ncbi:LysR family transcriptional regulator [Mannheimia granulomatis]|uniref:LysR family transcriptional regulator n=1 Tax=Mannheimia granulomatis TaxID=85402 RepID=UPI00047B27E9|nr:LysR family transcriptional regulator [Mannheimia granulomatis]QLB18204.1 transcriptional regulator [Mannheimia granulomatis]
MHNLNNLDLNLLKALHALLQEKNVSRAAERLNLTQPAVSNMLTKLRYRFDDPLFIRTAHGMIPTNRAEQLAEPVGAILDSIGVLMQPVAFDPADLDCTFKLAATENGIRTLGVPFALKLAQLAPKVKVAFYAIHGQDLTQNLADGVWDLAIAGQQQLDERLYFAPLMREEYTCAVRQNHPVLSQNWDLEAFCALEFVLVAYHAGHFNGATDEALAKLGRSRLVKMSVGHFSLLPELLKNSDLATVAPVHFLQTQNDLVLLNPPLPIDGYTKVMAWHAKTHYDPVQKWFRQVMKEVGEST